jgi:2'-5' RNA ligase
MEYKSAVMIFPPEPEHTAFSQLMKKYNAKYHASKALQFPPHITVMSLGVIPDHRFEIVSERLWDLAKEAKPFFTHSSYLDFTGSDEDHRGIYVHFDKNSNLYGLHRMCVERLKKFSDGKDRSGKELENWRPHVTLVGTDIKDEELDMAKAELSPSIEYSFLVKSVHLARIKNGLFDAPYSRSLGQYEY